jgi:hypothetical protein
MFEELNNAFPDHTHFYEVLGITMNEAMDRCARLTGDNPQVMNYNGNIIFALKHDLGNGIEWLRPVSGSPIDVVTE